MSSSTKPSAGRYGGSGLSARTVWIIASVAVIAFFSWVTWVFSTDKTTGIEWVAFESTGGETTAMMKFQITAPPGTPVTCALRTVDYSMGTNGWTVKSYPASNQFTTQYSETIKAVSEVSGIDVYRCWREDR
jgi:hypothetical protein